MDISVIIPLYNVENYISRTIDSVFAQDFGNFEIVVVDDCSTDGSLGKVEGKAAESKVPFRIIRNPENLGVAQTRNIGLKEARGEYVCFLDSDDFIQPKFLSNLYNLCKKNDLPYSYCLYQMVGDADFAKEPKRLFADKILSREEIFYLFLYRRTGVIIPGALLRKSFLVENKIEFLSDIKFTEDLMYMWRILFAAEKCGLVGETDYNYYSRSGSKMHATPVDDMYGAYKYYKSKKYLGGYTGNLPTDLILPRWIIGLLNTGARILTYRDFRKLANCVEYKKYIGKQFSMKDIRVKILALLLFVHPSLYYYFVRLKK